MEYLDEPLRRKEKPKDSTIVQPDINRAKNYPWTLLTCFGTSLLVAGIIDYRSSNLIDPFKQKRVFQFIGRVWMPAGLFLLVLPAVETAMWERIRAQVWFWQASYRTLPNPRLQSSTKH
jgi:hypothetical protein